jgi:glycosyltransferase involved in cell wall biosynthesis
MTRVFIISHEPVGREMAGPGIRCWEFAKVLSNFYEVTLAVPNDSDLQPSRFTLLKYSGGTLPRLAKGSDVIIVSGLTLALHPSLREQGIPLVLDVYDPFTLENLQLFSGRDMAFRQRDHNDLLAALNGQLLAADFLLCASENQRAYWLGMLSALNRVNPLTYSEDSSLRRLIDVVPFGLAAEEPCHSRDVLKGVHEAIAPNDKVVLWGGGIYNWLDPLTLIRAMGRIVEERGDVKAFFMGVRHPNPQVHEMKVCSEAIQLSKDLGLYGRYVFFNEWVPYEERQNYLLEADIGVSLHLNHLETAFSFRTRVLDYIWARLPMVVTCGDDMSALVQEHNLGKVVDYEAVDQLVSVLLEMLDTPDLRGTYAPRFEKAIERFSWSEVAKPLVEFCRSPRFAPDRAMARAASEAGGGFVSPQAAVSPTPWRLLLAKAWRCYRERGARALWREAVNHLRWRWHRHWASRPPGL